MDRSLPSPPRYAWHVRLSAVLDSMIEHIAVSIRAQLPGGLEESSEVAQMVHNAVGAGISTLTQAIHGGTTPLRLDLRTCAAMREIGAFVAGTEFDQALIVNGFAVARRAMLSQLLKLEREDAVPSEAVRPLHVRVWTVVAELMEQALEGYVENLPGLQGSVLRRSSLAEAIIHGEPESELQRRARLVGWPLPDECTIAAVLARGAIEGVAQAERREQLVRGLFGDRALGVLRGHLFVVVPHAPDVTAVREGVARHQGALRIVIGPQLALADAPLAARLVSRAAQTLPAESVTTCDEHLLELCDSRAWAALAKYRLAPLLRLSPAKRVTYADLLSADLEGGVLDKPESTLRYERNKLRSMFGSALTDRTKRVELTLALRAVLPLWRAEAAVDGTCRSPGRRESDKRHAR